MAKIAGCEMSSSNKGSRQRVAVLGAGPAGLAAAFALAETGKYDVHVYQMGWRAGGKCATGREPENHRALQNGSHYLFGSYFNSFDLIRRAHEIIAGSPESDKHMFGTFEGDFIARNLLVGKEIYKHGQVEEEQDWYRYMPQNMAVPGEDGKFPTPFDLAVTMGQLACGTLLDFMHGVVFSNSKSDQFQGVRIFLKALPLCPFDTSWRARATQAVFRPIRFLSNTAVRESFRLSHELHNVAEVLVPGKALRIIDDAWRNTWKGLAEGAQKRAVKFVDGMVDHPPTIYRGVQRLFVLLDLGLAIMTGYFVDGLNRPGGFEKIDHEEFQDWLYRHGADERAVNSALVKCWYDAVIAYEDGNRKKPKCSAAVAVHAILRALIGYKGAFAFQMHAEVGDSFIAPIVKALEIRGVKFHFYSRVKKIVVADDEPVIKKVVLGVQCADPPAKAQFIPVPDHSKPGSPKRKAWPSSPSNGNGADLRLDDSAPDPPLDSYYSTLENHERTLNRKPPDSPDDLSDDFDWVIAALPIGVMKDVLVHEDGRALAEEDGPWRDCFTHLKCTESQAVRIWFKVPLAPSNSVKQSLGWLHDPPILSGYEWPHSTWEDNSQARHVHSFPDKKGPQTIATVFGPLTTHAGDVRELRYAEEQLERAKAHAQHFVDSSMLKLWIGLERDGSVGEVDWDAFIDLKERTGANRFKWQHVAANVGPIESYVMVLPSTLQHRLRPDESGYRNLFIAGDWTRNGVEVGTVEGAVISGLKAARAISGSPEFIVGGDDFERGSVFQSVASGLSAALAKPGNDSGLLARAVRWSVSSLPAKALAALPRPLRTIMTP